MVRVEPVAWTPQKDVGLVGAYAPNDRLAAVVRIPVPGIGPEDVAATSSGEVVYGLADGRIMAAEPDGSAHRLIVDTGGRPLGIEIGFEDALIVCDADRGLLSVRDGSVEVLADRFEGDAFLFTNNAAVAADGSIYFSVTSRRFGIADYRSDVIEHSNTGRLLRRDPDGSLEVLIDDLSFANGVALSSDEREVFVAETGEYRIRRHDLGSGSTTTYLENLPGMPDNLTSHDGVIWAAMFTPRNKQLDFLLPRPRLRGLVARLPDVVQPQPVRHGFVVGFDESSGGVIHNLQDPEGGYAPVTSARVHEGRLWLGSLTEPAIGVVDL